MTKAPQCAASFEVLTSEGSTMLDSKRGRQLAALFSLLGIVVMLAVINLGPRDEKLNKRRQSYEVAQSLPAEELPAIRILPRRGCRGGKCG